ncbi:Uncharacterized membrane protein [Deinococcus reticulitermitis]|uniref:Uncharacterized membrane protein n=1 Tax=Deinococcus reticulitermitis TaxID=856736 RepID=A0A1H7AVV3_9DEIO|nr:DUF1622 domain-containing protein [Deinococcus reticulitermitis]SEJ68754.1 Uncharacterized membrane protein [Deinococcus reticulitermitis]
MEVALQQLEHFVQLGAQTIARLAELAAALIIAVAVGEALWRAARIFWRRDRGPDELKESLRLQLGRWLAISLEFLLAADVVLTAIAPTWDDIGKLGAVAFIRTALNYFLQKEIEAHELRRGRVDSPHLG